MNKLRGINEKKDYGRINITMSKLMDEYDISSYKLSKLADLKYNTVKSYYTNAPITRIDLDVIAKLCYVLDCQIGDIVEYVKPEN